MKAQVTGVRELVLSYGPPVSTAEPVQLSDPASVVRHLEAIGLAHAPRERFVVVHLNGKHRAVSYEIVSVGTATSSLVHPREVFCGAVRSGAAAIIVAHNHPSGDPEPSREDIEVTERLVSAGRLLGIPVLDHVVIGLGRSVSMRERGYLNAR